MNESQPSPQTPLKNSILQEITAKQLTPRPWWYFFGRECVVWSLWLLSITVGAFAVAVSLYVVTHRQYELYEATHANFFTFLVEALPFLWLFTFGLMVWVAIYNLRHTKRGYRYPVSVLIVSSLGLSFAGGTGLQMLGVGYAIDDILGQNMDMYMSQAKLERKLWQMPAEGRLLGRQVLSTVSPTTSIVFADEYGDRWSMNVSELTPHDMDLLASGQQVRILGSTTNADLYLFHACGAFPWMIDPAVTMKDMSKEREMFIEKVYSHMQKAEQRLELLEAKTFAADDNHTGESVCANLAVVKRMPSTAH